MKILCVDFDGVIHRYDSPYIDEVTIPDDPVQDAFQFLEEASEFFDIVIYSSRSKSPEGIQAMKDWFEKHLKLAGHDLAPDWYMHLTFANTKPPAFLTIDDRAFCFEGNWPDPKKLADFKPWNKR